MAKETDSDALARRLDDLLGDLLLECAASRCTIRLDDPRRGWKVDFVCAEAIRPGVASLRRDGSIDQRGAETVKWLAANKRNLIQPSLVNDPDLPPDFRTVD